MDNRLEIEDLTKQVIDIRKQRYSLELKEKGVREQIINILKKNKKHLFAFGDVSLELKTFPKKTLKPNHNLSDDYFDVKIVEQLFIKTKQDIQLIGNKFILRKKDGL